MTMNNTATRPMGIAGTSLGLLALGIAFFHFVFGPIESKPIEQTAVEIALNIKNAAAARIQGISQKPVM